MINIIKIVFELTVTALQLLAEIGNKEYKNFI